MNFRKFQQNKLWRNKAVDLMENMGSKIHWTKLNDAQFLEQLKLKLIEETEEVCAATTKDEILEELADVLEVISSFCDVYKFRLQDIVDMQNKKREERGSFSERKFISVAEHAPDSFGEKYCLKDPEKYPEILD